MPRNSGTGTQLSSGGCWGFCANCDPVPEFWMHLCGCNGNGQSSAQLQEGASILIRNFFGRCFSSHHQGDSPCEEDYSRQKISERDALRLTELKIFLAQKTRGNTAFSAPDRLFGNKPARFAIRILSRGEGAETERQFGTARRNSPANRPRRSN